MDTRDYIQLGDFEDDFFFDHEPSNQNHQQQQQRKSFSKNNDHYNRMQSQPQRSGQKSNRYWESQSQSKPIKRNYPNVTVTETRSHMRFPPFRDESHRYLSNSYPGTRFGGQASSYASPGKHNNTKHRRNGNNNGGESKPKQLLNPFSVANQAKLHRLNKMKQKHARANQARTKVMPPPGLDRSRLGAHVTSTPGQQNKKIVFLDEDEDEEEDVLEPNTQPSTSSQFKLPAAPSTSQAKPQTQRVVSMVDESSGNMEVRIKGTDPNFSDDDVIEVPVPPPEVVTLDDSDDESTKNNEKDVPTPRCLSPSNSSMMSDDFIERRDRKRIRETGAAKDQFYWGEQTDASTVNPSTEHVPMNPMSVSSSSESQADNHEEEPEAGTSCGPIIRGEAVERCYDKTKKAAAKQKERTKSERQSFSTDNYSDENFMDLLSDIIQHGTDDEDDAEDANTSKEGVDERPPALFEEPEKERTPSPESDVMLNVVTNNPQDIRQAMPDAAERPPFQPQGPEVGWNEEMRRFYHESWGGETFETAKITYAMPRDSSLWTIDYEDRFRRLPPRMNVRCRNCQEFTHKVQNCPQPKKKIVCFMCGEWGHKEPRCPNTVCLTCGAPSKTFMRNCHRCCQERQNRCSLCNCLGHSYKRCPDKWRRYHNTVEDNVDLNQEYVRNNRECCSVCTAKGHSSHYCKQAPQWMGGNLPKTNIFSYLPIYDYAKKDDRDNIRLARNERECTYSLISFNENFKFNWSENVKKCPNGQYTRFRTAVDLKSDDDDGDDEAQTEVQRETSEPRARRRGRKRTHDEAEAESDDDQVEIVNIDYSNISQENTALNPINLIEEFADDSDAEGELVIDEQLPQQLDKSMQFEDADESAVASTSTSDHDHSLRDFSFNNELKKVYETREFHIDIDSNQLSQSTPEVVFRNEQEALQRTAESLHIDVASLRQVMANSIISFPVDDLEPSEFIPLTKPEDQKVEAKLLLPKDQATRLLEDEGIFLKEMEQKHNLYLTLVWEQVGHILVMYGTVKNQNAFMPEFKQFCKKVTWEEHQKRMENSMNCMPRHPKKLMAYIREHLDRLKNDFKTIRDIKDAYYNMTNHMKAHEYKAADRHRKILNMFLLGRIGLSGGKDAVIGMIKIHDRIGGICTKSSTTPDEWRKELNEHMSYIFTAKDHGNYRALLDDYDTCNKNKSWPLRKSQINNIGELRKLIHRQQPGGAGPSFFIDRGLKNEPETIDSPDSTTADNNLETDNRPPPLQEYLSPDHPQNDNENEDFIPIGNDTLDPSTPTTPTSSTIAGQGTDEVLYDPRRPPTATRYYSYIRDANTNTLTDTDTNETIQMNPTITPVVGIEPLPVPAFETTPINNKIVSTNGEAINQIEPVEVYDSSDSTPQTISDVQKSNSTKTLDESIEITTNDNIEPITPSLPEPTLTPKVENKAEELAAQSLEIISQAIILFKSSNNQRAIKKLMQVKQKALEKQISENDFNSLLAIQKIVKEKLGDDK